MRPATAAAFVVFDRMFATLAPMAILIPWWRAEATKRVPQPHASTHTHTHLPSVPSPASLSSCSDVCDTSASGGTLPQRSPGGASGAAAASTKARPAAAAAASRARTASRASDTSRSKDACSRFRRSCDEHFSLCSRWNFYCLSKLFFNDV